AGRRVPDSKAHELLYVSPMRTRDSGFGIRDSSGFGARDSSGFGARDSLGFGARDSRAPLSVGPGVVRESRIPTPESPTQSAFWRTLDEKIGDPAFQERLYNEFPSLLPTIEQVADPVARRTFRKLRGASLALAGVSACTRQPPEKIVPYVRQPEDLITGKPLFYATAMTVGGVAAGLLVESHEGRPTKIEGNPLHPGSLGSSRVFAQAAVLGLYDPGRCHRLRNLRGVRPWSAVLAPLHAAR